MDSKDSFRYESLPIPTYEEATSSRPPSSLSRHGSGEISDDAEREGLLRSDPDAQPTNYQPPSVESARSSLDGLDGLHHDSEEEVRREMQQMEFDNSASSTSSRISLLSKHLTSFTSSFPSFRFPSFRQYIPGFSLAHINEQISANRGVIIGRMFGVFVILTVIYVLVAWDVLSVGRHRMPMGQMYDQESVRMFVQERVNRNGNIQEYLRHITQFPHLAGTEGNYVLGEWVAELFKAAELEDVDMERFDVYLNYPRKDGRRVAIVEPESKRWEAAVEEVNEQDYVFHGLSKSGNVTGPLVFANYGRRPDFQMVQDAGISFEDAIALLRYDGSELDKALKVKAAELAGAVGCLIYTDPSQDHSDSGPTFPDGRFMPEDGVHRGSVGLSSWVVGDVLSPGWASTPADRNRLKLEETTGLNQIPSIPISWRDAKHLLESIQGHGKNMTDSWKWIPPQFDYWTGDPQASDSPKVNLKNIQDEEIYQPIYNVIGRISGWEQTDKKIIIGNHRDAWCTGAADPGSGTAVMLEVVRVFGDLRRQNWRPLRTIEFASWDGEEYNLIGSTEHVENRMEELRQNGVAYINIDSGVSGDYFRAFGNPLFERPLLAALGRVNDPSFNQTSLREHWDHLRPASFNGLATFRGFGAGSDYVAFQDLAGTSSIDLSFSGEEFPDRSCYDNFDWMERFGDNESFDRHTALAQVIALMILELADEPLLAFNLNSYVESINNWIRDLEGYIGQKGGSDIIDMTRLHNALNELAEQAQVFHQWDNAWNSFVLGAGGYESNVMSMRRMERNSRLAEFETDLLDLSEGGGLPGRTQFKHVVFSPQKWSGYDEGFFPGIRDAVAVKDWEAAQPQVQKVADILSNAARRLTREEG